MAKSKTITISQPFDARHVGGVSIPGVTIPIAGMQRSHTMGLQPDAPPSHTNVATGMTEVKRSNTIASSLSRPGLRLKSSMSLLRSRSHTLDTLPRRETATPDMQDPDMMSIMSMKMQPSLSRLRARAGLDTGPVGDADGQDRDLKGTPLPPPPPLPKDTPALKLKTSFAHVGPYSMTASPQDYSSPQSAQTYTPISRKTSQRRQAVVVRPKRADSGTAIDFNNVPADERPLGFKEILTVRGFPERMALYKKTRDFWANTDHGLAEWTCKAGGPKTKPIPYQV